MRLAETEAESHHLEEAIAALSEEMASLLAGKDETTARYAYVTQTDLQAAVPASTLIAVRCPTGTHLHLQGAS